MKKFDKIKLLAHKHTNTSITTIWGTSRTSQATLYLNCYSVKRNTNT